MASLSIPRWLRLVLVVTGVSALTLTVSAWLFLRSLSPMSRCDEWRFTSARWNDSALVYSAKAIRGCIVDDLVRRHDLHARTRAEIVGLLGEPPRTHYFSEYDLVYWLGPERGLVSIDSEWLVFRLDSSGRVSEYRLVTD